MSASRVGLALVEKKKGVGEPVLGIRKVGSPRQEAFLPIVTNATEDRGLPRDDTKRVPCGRLFSCEGLRGPHGIRSLEALYLFLFFFLVGRGYQLLHE